MKNYMDLAKTVLEEHKNVLMDVKPDEVEQLLVAIAAAESIKVFGMGRMKCSVRGFTMRLMHAGFDAHVVFDTTCPNLAPGDLLIVNGGCTGIGHEVTKMASRLGVKIAVITADTESPIAELADIVVSLRGQVHGGRDYEIPSVQPMAALFEQTIFIFEDIIIQLLMTKLNIDIEAMKARHINVDGYMDFNERS